MGVRVYMLDKLTDEFFISTAATDLSSLVNLTIVVQLKIQAVTVNLASFARHDLGSIMTYRWVINRCVLLQFTWSNHWMKAQLNATLIQI